MSFLEISKPNSSLTSLTIESIGSSLWSTCPPVEEYIPPFSLDVFCIKNSPLEFSI